MRRREALATGAMAITASFAGCFGNSETTADGYGPEPESVPNERSIDTDSYETKKFDGIDVPLASIDDVFYWYQRQEARIADARQSDQYKQAHIAGAVLSSAPDGGSNDPVADWSKDDRIVTYCACPHHLSGLRAASLIDNNYEEVYAIDEGFISWLDRGYPAKGTEVNADRATYKIHGQSDPAYAGEFVILEQLEADRAEAAPIQDDGSYTLQLHYAGSSNDRFAVETPTYRIEGSLKELTGSVVTT